MKLEELYWNWGFLLFLIPWVIAGTSASYICHQRRLHSESHRRYKEMGLCTDTSAGFQDALLVPLGPISLLLVLFTDVFTV